MYVNEHNRVMSLGTVVDLIDINLKTAIIFEY